MQVIKTPFSWSEYFYTFAKDARQAGYNASERWETWKDCSTGKKAIEELGEKKTKELFFNNFCVW